MELTNDAQVSVGEALVVETKIVAAELYRSGCTITRRGHVALAEGKNLLVLRGLPEGFDENSVSLRTAAEVSQGQVRVVREVSSPWDLPNSASSASELSVRIDELDRQIDNLQLELDSWKSLSASYGGPQALDLLDRLPGKLDELTSRLTALRAERTELGRERDRIREEAARPYLEVSLASPRALETPIEVLLRSDHAGWVPAFDVLADSEAGTLSLRLRAKASQRTGEDWEGVALTLSTGSTSGLGALPSFAPRYLSKERPAPPRAYSAPSPRAFAMAPSLSGGVPKPSMGDTLGDTGLGLPVVQDLKVEESTAEEQATSTTYELAGPQTLRGEGQELAVTVSTTEMPARYYRYAYPRREEAAYLVARLESEPGPALFERPASVYIDGSYAGTMRIARSGAEEGFELPLGRDERVRVRRTEDVRRSKSLLGGKVTTEYASTITVENRHADPVTAVVVEQVPVSRDKEIEVSARELSGATHDEARGELRWERTVAPGESVTLKASYLVAHAKGVEVFETSAYRPASPRSFCPRCGSPMDAGVGFCPACGYRP